MIEEAEKRGASLYKVLSKLINEHKAGAAQFTEFADDVTACLTFSWHHEDGEWYKAKLQVNKNGFDAGEEEDVDDEAAHD